MNDCRHSERGIDGVKLTCTVCGEIEYECEVCDAEYDNEEEAISCCSMESIIDNWLNGNKKDACSTLAMHSDRFEALRLALVDNCSQGQATELYVDITKYFDKFEFYKNIN